MATVLESDVIAGVMLVEPVVHGDARGLFLETFRHEWIPNTREMVQMNRADRQAGILRVHAIHQDVPFTPAMTEAIGREIALTPFDVEDSYITLPTTPGLGIELDEAALARYPVRDRRARHIRQYTEE